MVRHAVYRPLILPVPTFAPSSKLSREKRDVNHRGRSECYCFAKELCSPSEELNSWPQSWMYQMFGLLYQWIISKKNVGKIIGCPASLFYSNILSIYLTLSLALYLPTPLSNTNSCDDVRYAAAFALRQRMLHFVQTYEHYMMFEVLEPSWHIMERSLKTVWCTWLIIH